MDGFEAVVVYVGIYLGGADIGMAEHHLNGAQVGAMSQQMGGKGVAQHMRGDVLAYTGGGGCFFENLPVTPSGHGLAPGGDEQGISAFGAEDGGTTFLEILLEMVFGGFAEGHQPLFAALAQDPDEAGVEITGDQRQLHQFTHPQAGGVEQIDHGGVPQTDRPGGDGGNQQSVHFVYGQCLGQCSAAFGQIDGKKGVGGDEALLAEKNEKDLERRYASGVGAVGNSFFSGVFEEAVDEGQVDRYAAFNPTGKKKSEKPGNIGTVGCDCVAGQASLREKVPVEFLMEMFEMSAQYWCVRFLFQRRQAVD